MKVPNPDVTSRPDVSPPGLRSILTAALVAAATRGAKRVYSSMLTLEKLTNKLSGRMGKKYDAERAMLQYMIPKKVKQIFSVSAEQTLPDSTDGFER